MVFHLRCFSFDVQEVQSADNFYTANSQFDLRPNVSVPTNQREYTSRPNPDKISSSLRAFTLDELKKATNNFDEKVKLGEGGFGSVYFGTIKRSEHHSDDIPVAVKRGKKGPKGQRQWQNEVNFLGEIKHPNLVKLIGQCYEDHGNESNWLLVYEYMPNNSLDDHLTGKSKKPLSWAMRLKIARDAATGLQYLHEGMGRQIIFRDFKPSNVLLDEQWNAKLSDFGFVRDGPQDGKTHVSTSVVGTKGYAAPEYVQTGRLTFKIDVWSYGIFLEELITGLRPVVQKNTEIDPECMRWVCCYAGAGKSKPIVDPRIEGDYSEKSMQMVSSIAEKCLVKDPKLRPKMSEVLEMVNEAIALENQRHLNGGQT